MILNNTVEEIASLCMDLRPKVWLTYISMMNLKKKLFLLFTFLKVNLNSNDIDITHHLPTSRFGEMPVIIKFVKRSTGNTALNKKRLLHKTGFALTESLIKRRLQLFSLVKKEFGKDSVWTLNGSIYCRPIHDGNKFLISSKKRHESNNTCRNTSILPLLYVSIIWLGVFPSKVDEKNGGEKESEL